MVTNANNARIFGSDLDSIYLAPLGTALPSGPTGITDALNGAFVDVGWLSSDGIGEELSGSKTKLRGHQGGAVIRTRMTETGTEYTFVCGERTAQLLGLRYAESGVSTTGGVRTATRAPSQKVTALAAVLDFFDVDNTTVKERLAIPRFEITPDGTATFKSDDILWMPFRGEIIGSATHWTNTPTPKTVWTLTITGSPSGGTYTILVNGFATAPIAYNANAAAIDAAIDALVGVTGATVTVTGTGPWTLTFPTAVTVSSSSAGLTGGTSPTAAVS